MGAIAPTPSGTCHHQPRCPCADRGPSEGAFRTFLLTTRAWRAPACAGATGNVGFAAAALPPISDGAAGAPPCGGQVHACASWCEWPERDRANLRHGLKREGLNEGPARCPAIVLRSDLRPNPSSRGSALPRAPATRAGEQEAKACRPHAPVARAFNPYGTFCQD